MSNEKERAYFDAGRYRMPFGKYSDQKLADIAVNDPNYLEWAEEHIKGGFVAKAVKKFLDLKRGRPLKGYPL